MTIAFVLDGAPFTALNAGPQFKFNESISFVVRCESQDEVDYYWRKLTEGGSEIQCGWLRDKYGLCWQIVPTAFFKLLSDPDAAKVQRVMKAMMQMKKLDMAVLERAAQGD